MKTYTLESARWRPSIYMDEDLRCGCAVGHAYLQETGKRLGFDMQFQGMFPDETYDPYNTNCRVALGLSHSQVAEIGRLAFGSGAGLLKRETVDALNAYLEEQKLDFRFELV